MSEIRRIYSADPISDSPPKSTRQCKNCSNEAPGLSSDQTLVSSLGWRLVIDVDLFGHRVGEWHCPECWSRRRAARNSMRSP